MKLLKTGVWTLVFLLVGLTGCQDEDFPSMSAPEVPGDVNTTRAISASSALVQDPTTGYWKANKRVPLVGQGRVIDDIANQLISVISTTNESNLGNLVDLDLTNAATFNTSAVGVNLLADQIVSVRDLNHVYEGGQTVGFTYKLNDASLISADVLKGFWIKTFLGDKEQQTMTGSNDETGLLNLNLLSTLNTDNIQSLSFQTDPEKPFDKVKIGFVGLASVDALNILGNLNLYYFYVGEDPIKPVYEGSADFPKASINEEKTERFDKKELQSLIDSNLTNTLTISGLLNSLLTGDIGGILDDLINGLLNNPATICIDLGQEVPAGTEIGFYMDGFSVLKLNLLSGISFHTYDGAGNQVEEFTAENSGLLGVSALGGGNNSMAVTVGKPCSQIQIRFKGVNLDVLGKQNIYYAYVREAATADISSYFSVSDVTISGNSYHLPQPAEGSVKWTCIESVSGSKPIVAENSSKIYNMTVDGDYKMSGTFTYTDDDGASQAQTVSFTITRKTPDNENCNQLIGSEFNAIAEIPEGGGALITTDHVKNLSNIVDDDINNYASYNSIGELTVGVNYGIACIKLGDGKTINSEKAPKRVGFTMQTQSQFLSVDALKFFRIVLKKDGKQVDGGVTDNNNVVSADLIGSQGNKVRMGIKTEEAFDQIELWVSGVAGLSLGNEYRIYNAFYEDATEGGPCENYDASEACIEMLTAAQGAEINYTSTLVGGLASVAGSLNNLSKILDDDKLSYATITDTEVIGGTTVSVKFPEMPAGTQVGFIISMPAYVASNIGLLEGTAVETYLEGVSTGDSGETGTGSLADISLIGYDGRAFVEVCPQYPFDEVRLNLAGLVNALQIVYVHGAYVRRDSDNDGIPDCAEDDENPDGSLDEGKIKMSLDASDVCMGDKISISAQIGVGASTENLYLKLIPTKSSGQKSLIKKVKIENSKIVLAEGGNLTMDNADIYSLRLYASEEDAKNDNNQLSSEAPILYVHPKETIWKGTSSSDWNDWDNWTNGSPWGCTNVIIPANCANYPVLEADEENNCANIYIEHGGQVVHTQYLTYDQAWVDLTLDEGCYYMLTSPLTDMVSGDWFVNATANESWSKFTALTNNNYPENRLNPIVYQRLWSTNAPVKNPGGYANVANETVIAPDETQWTPPYNAVSQAYGLGQSFSLMAGKSKNGKKATFRFPKTHTEYNYYDLLGNPTGMKESVHNGDVAKGRFADDEQWNNGTLTVTVKNGIANDVFLVGNPFVSHLDLKEFMTRNGISEVKLYDGNTYNPLILIDGQLVSLNNETSDCAKPMEAFFVTIDSKAASKDFTFTSDMQTATSNTASGRSRSGSVSASQMLRLTASVSGYDAQCLLRVSRKASEGVVSGEDTRLLIDGEAHPEVAVYTVADGEALDIQQIPATVTRVPLGFYLRSGKGDVELRFDYTDRLWQGWSLLDTQSGERRSLANVINLKAVESGSTRYVLVKN